MNGRHVLLKDGKPAPGFDHGVLNISLSKRGDIDAQLDKYKADKAAKEAKENKAASAEKKTEKQRAKELLAEHGDALEARFGAKMAKGELKRTLQDMAKWEPKKLIMLVEKHKKETGQ